VSAIAADLDVTTIGWTRREFDLDSTDPQAQARALIDRDRPGVVLHAAAWTDVDGCAREPDIANRRNGDALGALARACAAAGVRLLAVSTNEVFDGKRTDGRAYVESDAVAPANPYGASKARGEELARDAFADQPGLWIARTAWLYGPPGNDFPTKIVAASDRNDAANPREPLPVVADETGSPTYTLDLAAAILALVRATDGGVFHLVNAGTATRYSWAEAIVRQCRPDRTLRPISQKEFVRPSTPPAWGVLDGSKAASAGVTLRPWNDALREYLQEMC